MMQEPALKRSSTSQSYRNEILRSPLPLLLEYNLITRSRVVVRTVDDLDTYVIFINEMCSKHHHFHGHKKAIAELLNISTNRISEWQRIWIAATQTTCPIIKAVYEDKTSTLAYLVKTMKENGWEACPGGGYLKNSPHLTPKKRSLSYDDKLCAQQLHEHTFREAVMRPHNIRFNTDVRVNVNVNESENENVNVNSDINNDVDNEVNIVSTSGMSPHMQLSETSHSFAPDAHSDDADASTQIFDEYSDMMSEEDSLDISFDLSPFFACDDLTS